MIKNIFLIIFLFFIYSCGYTSVYKKFGNQNFQIIITEMQGNREMNNLLKNEINLYSNKNSVDKFNVALKTKYDKLILAKNEAGETTDYQLSAVATFTIYFNEKSQTLTFEENINIKNQTDSFEQNIYEKNVKRNFASSIRNKLISKIINLQ